MNDGDDDGDGDDDDDDNSFKCFIILSSLLYFIVTSGYDGSYQTIYENNDHNYFYY